MPDIAMCSDDKCPSRASCYRFVAVPSKHLQTWGRFQRPADAEKCAHYWPLDRPDVSVRGSR